VIDGGPLTKSEHRRLARSWLSKALDAMKHASVDAVHGRRAKDRLREAERLIDGLQNITV
jgi:hypothetical protein